MTITFAKLMHGSLSQLVQFISSLILNLAIIKMSNQHMRRRADKSMVKLYKDLMISKRQLIDLRQSIQNTLTGLRKPIQKYSLSATRRKKICSLCSIPLNPAMPHQCRLSPYKCEVCFLSFSTNQSLTIHNRQKHFICRLCDEVHNYQPEIHEAQFCGEKRIQCDHCGAKIKRKDISQHTIKCCFYFCYKCKKNIFFKAFSYHVSKCYQEIASAPQDLTRTKKIVRNTNFVQKKYNPSATRR